MGSRGGTEDGEDRPCRRHTDIDTVIVPSPSTSLERRSCNLPTVSAMYGPQGWADLPDALLHSIASLLVSFPDLLAFATTCPSWRAAFSSYPSKSSFLKLFPPILLQSDVPLCTPRPRPCCSSLVPRRQCYVTNLANQNMYMCCQIPRFCDIGNRNGLPNPLETFLFIGASYGHLILSNIKSCLVVDVFTGISVSPPQLPVDEDTRVCPGHGTLTAPLAPPNSHLMVNSQSENFFWRVGSNSWVRQRRSACDLLIKQLVIFKGQVFGTDNVGRLFVVHLVPHIRIQEISVDRGKNTRIIRLSQNWLVVCGDMLLMVCFLKTGVTFEAFCLDLSAEPAKWVKVEKLENWAIFLSTDCRSQALCCMEAERWGGRTNCIYCYNSKEWTACELGKPLQRGASIPRFYYGSFMQPMWVAPSMFYPCL